MTSLSHVEILRRGPQAWNEWRAQNPAERPRLSHVALSLGERQWGPMHGGPINFKSAILPDASLRFASLVDADLQAADLTRADLVHARLDRANLKNAILTDAVLDHADFADAHLGRAILTGASLSHARNLTQDQIDETIGDASTTLPAHLERPTAWVKIAPTPPPSQAFYQKALIASASACLVAGVILFGVPRDEQHFEPTAGATKPHQMKQPPASSQASEGSTTPRKSTEATVGQSASSNEKLPIGSAVRVEGVQGLHAHEEGVTAWVELNSPVAALASLGRSERWPSIAILAAPTANELQAILSGAETAPPLPDRKPVVVRSPPKDTMATATYVKPAAPTANELRVIPPSAETAPPLPDRNPVLVQLPTKRKMTNPTYVTPAAAAHARLTAPPSAATAPPPDRKPVVVQPPAKSRLVVRAHVKLYPPGPRRPEVVQKALPVKPRSSTADVLAGGL